MTTLTEPTASAQATTGDGDPADRAAEALRAELEGLVRIAARRPQLTVHDGEPGCAWSFSWDTDVVTVDPRHLRTLAPDLCRGLALHEAAHAAVTVLHRIVPFALLTRLHPLLNAIEDMRIEVWMRARFPGAVAWIRAYNDVFHGFSRGATPPRCRQVQFLVGILELWWYGTTPAGTLPEVVAALDACREPIAAAIACQPPLDDDPDAILASQRAMWRIVRERIAPVWARLVGQDRRDGLARLAISERRQYASLTGDAPRRQGGPRGRRTSRRTSVRTVPQPAGRRRKARRGDGGCAGAETETPGSARPCRDEPWADGDAYLAAWKRVAPAADRLADELLRVLVPRSRLRWSTGHASGPRLDLRRALQFEADPRHYRSLWCRPVLPKRRDPAVLLLLDRSGSMTGDGRMDRAFEGTVLLTEVCRRIGVPAAVWSFAKVTREELAWDAAVDGPARRRMGRLVAGPAGNTDMAAALVVAGRESAARRGDPNLLFVISDGAPDDHEATLAAVARLEAQGIVPIGLGLGQSTAGLARYFRHAVTGIPPERLVDHVAELLGTALMAPA